MTTLSGEREIAVIFGLTSTLNEPPSPLPSVVVYVTVAVPTLRYFTVAKATESTIPLAATETTAGLELVHLSSLMLALEGSTLTSTFFSLSTTAGASSPPSETVCGSSFVILISSPTVTEQLDLTVVLPDFTSTETVVEPCRWAVTVPS